MKKLSIAAALAVVCSGCAQTRSYKLDFVDGSEERSQAWVCARPKPGEDKMVCMDLESFLIEVVGRSGIPTTRDTIEM